MQGQLLVAVLLNDTQADCERHMKKLLRIFQQNGFDIRDVVAAGSRFLLRVDLSSVRHAYVPAVVWQRAHRNVAWHLP